MAMVRTERLTRFYGEHLALDGVDVEIEAGEIVGVLGLNGAGKSTFLKILAGLLAPSDGSAHVDGVDVTEAAHTARARIGFLPETPPLHDEMIVDEFLHFTGELKGMTRDAVDARLPEVTAMVGLPPEMRRRVIGELSHGYRKRVGIAQAILHSPALVILDEPISGLDPRQIVEMRDTIDGLRGKHTVLVSSHILSEVSQTCDRILLIHEGRLVASGPQAEVSRQLTASGQLELVLRGEAEALEGFFGGREDVARHMVVSLAEGQCSARVTLEDPEGTESLVAGLVGAGFGVLRVTSEHSMLESAFLSLTGAPEAAEEDAA